MGSRLLAVLRSIKLRILREIIMAVRTRELSFVLERETAQIAI